VADQQLAEAAARRNDDSMRGSPKRGRSLSRGRRSESRSVLSSGSVSTISTNRSRSRSPFHHDDCAAGPARREGRRSAWSKTRSHSRPHKRKHRSISSSYSRSPPKVPGSHRKNRRHRTISPVDRGRPSSLRRGSHRSRSNSVSMDKSQITKQRRSLDVDRDYDHDHDDDHDDGKRRDSHRDSYRRGQSPPNRYPHGAGNSGRQPVDDRTGGRRKERSLSPYSKRLALTQAMNMGT